MIKFKKGSLVAKAQRKTYGSMPEFTIVNDLLLPKIILRSAVVADTMVQQETLDKGKGMYVSGALKRCELIKEIKKRAWLEGKNGEGSNDNFVLV